MIIREIIEGVDFTPDVLKEYGPRFSLLDPPLIPSQTPLGDYDDRAVLEMIINIKDALALYSRDRRNPEILQQLLNTFDQLQTASILQGVQPAIYNDDPRDVTMKMWRTLRMMQRLCNQPDQLRRYYGLLLTLIDAFKKFRLRPDYGAPTHRVSTWPPRR